MSLTIIPTGGPMWNQPLSDERAKALMAVDATAPLPAAMTAYIMHLERAYLDMRADHNHGFLRDTWEARTETTTHTAGKEG